ncbi:MAG: META domain-containing protein [Chloroflexia bacterium]|nr:META domain-containing protein [Chloroflexia bacterium]
MLASLNGTPIETGVEITLSFTQDQAGGSAGCNGYGGSYSANADGEFSTTDIFNTEMACEEPANVMDLESTYLELFSHATRYSIVDDQLELGGAESSKTLVYTQAGKQVAAASPTIASAPDVTVSPTPEANTPSSEAPAPSPTAPFVDVSPLDAPDLGVIVHWLGDRFEPGGDLAALTLTSVYGPAEPGGGPADSRGELEYSVDPLAADIKLRLMRRADWDTWAARDPASDDHVRILHVFWNSLCAQQEEVELDGGRAVIYSSYQALADPAVKECPDGPFDRFLAHVFIGDTVVLVNAPHFLEPPDMPSFQGAYNSVDGMRAVVLGLQPREPVAEPTPLPIPAASLDDLRSLVLQPADLPGRYGDDGCAPDGECNTGPGTFSSEGGYDDLQMAAGEFLATNVQYEHAGFSSGGTPDLSTEPPRIDSFVLVCVTACDPATILEMGAELLRYYGHADAIEVETAADIGDAARLYETHTLVLGQVATGHAVVWRDGPVVGMVVVGGVTGEQGQQIAIELARSQQGRIQQATGS